MIKIFKKFYELLKKELKTTDIPRLKHSFSYAFLTVLFWQLLIKFFHWKTVSLICLILILILSITIELLEVNFFNQPEQEIYYGVVYALAGFFLGSFAMTNPLIALALILGMVFKFVAVILGIAGVIIIFVIYLLNLIK